MRTIKFRGKRVDNGEWAYGSYFIGAFNTHWIVTIEFVFTPIQEETVGQFTGLFDKNGKEIYEGDLVKVITVNGLEKDTIHAVTYGLDQDYPAFDLEPYLDSECNSLQYLMICKDVYQVEVIGNVHDDKDLLE